MCRHEKYRENNTLRIYELNLRRIRKMGMSASQARLLSLTSRMSDLELKAQSISNSKIRLADEGSAASKAYSDALDKQTLKVYSGYNTTSGTAVYANATAANLTSYDPSAFGKQRFIEDASGKVLVSSDVVEAYNASNTSDEFINAMGYTKYTAADMTSNNATALLDKLDSDVAAVTNAIAGTNGPTIDSQTGALTSAAAILKSTTLFNTPTPTTAWSGGAAMPQAEHITLATNLATIRTVLTTDKAIIDSNINAYGTDAVTRNTLQAKSDNIGKFLNALNAEILWTSSDNVGWDVGQDLLKLLLTGSNNTAASTGKTQAFINAGGAAQASNVQPFITAAATTNLDALLTSLDPISGATQTTYYTTNTQGQMATLLQAVQDDLNNIGNTFSGTELNAYLGTFTNLASLSTAALTSNDLDRIKGVISSISDPKLTAGINAADINTAAGSLGEALTGEINDNGQYEYDPAAGTYYENLYNELSAKGGQSITSDEMNSSEWLQAGIQTGTLFLYEYNKTGGIDGLGAFENVSWASGDSTLQEVTDSTQTAKAEAEYETTMANIQAKDKRFDLQLKQIDTEHTAVQTEVDSVKKVIDKNIERGFKIFDA